VIKSLSVLLISLGKDFEKLNVGARQTHALSLLAWVGREGAI
jgi:hypothetical protein